MYDATFYRPSCLQPPQEQEKIRQFIPNFPPSNFSEDCLYLNIFAPNVQPFTCACCSLQGSLSPVENGSIHAKTAGHCIHPWR